MFKLLNFHKDKKVIIAGESLYKPKQIEPDFKDIPKKVWFSEVLKRKISWNGEELPIIYDDEKDRFCVVRNGEVVMTFMINFIYGRLWLSRIYARGKENERKGYGTAVMNLLIDLANYYSREEIACSAVSNAVGFYKKMAPVVEAGGLKLCY